MTKNRPTPLPLTPMADTGYQMTPVRRELFLRIVDGYFQNVEAITNRLYFLDNHFPPAKLDRALQWIIAHRNTGAAFILWYKTECKGSDLEMHRFLLTVVDNLENQRVIAGKNFKV